MVKCVVYSLYSFVTQRSSGSRRWEIIGVLSLLQSKRWLRMLAGGQFSLPTSCSCRCRLADGSRRRISPVRIRNNRDALHYLSRKVWVEDLVLNICSKPTWSEPFFTWFCLFNTAYVLFTVLYFTSFNIWQVTLFYLLISRKILNQHCSFWGNSLWLLSSTF